MVAEDIKTIFILAQFICQVLSETDQDTIDTNNYIYLDK